MKCKYENKTYEVVEVAGETLRIKSKDQEFCIHKDNVKILQDKAVGKTAAGNPRA